MTIEELDKGDKTEIAARLLECCGSSEWVQKMLAARPLRTLEHVKAAANEIWWNVKPADWLEAFAKHPKIGETGTVSEWSAQEQGGMQFAAARITSRLAVLNHAYLDKFGWIFIVCATGKSAAEMLNLLEARLPNQPADELRIAASEQSKITLLRLQKLLS